MGGKRKLMNKNNLAAIDFISIASFLLGLENLQENREQSEHNDIQIANDKQAKYLLEKIFQKFEEQNKLLEEILRRLENEKTINSFRN